MSTRGGGDKDFSGGGGKSSSFGYGGKSDRDSADYSKSQDTAGTGEGKGFSSGGESPAGAAPSGVGAAGGRGTQAAAPGAGIASGLASSAASRAAARAGTAKETNRADPTQSLTARYGSPVASLPSVADVVTSTTGFGSFGPRGMTSPMTTGATTRGAAITPGSGDFSQFGRVGAPMTAQATPVAQANARMDRDMQRARTELNPREQLAAGAAMVGARFGLTPEDIATIMSYETAGTFDPAKQGPTTRWGRHEGLIQWGQPQQAKFGVDIDGPVIDQMRAVGNYMHDAGLRPGMSFGQAYSSVNAGGVTSQHMARSDRRAGGMPGTVADKVASREMREHRANARDLLEGRLTRRDSPMTAYTDRAVTPVSARFVSAPTPPSRPADLPAPASVSMARSGLTGIGRDPFGNVMGFRDPSNPVTGTTAAFAMNPNDARLGNFSRFGAMPATPAAPSVEAVIAEVLGITPAQAAPGVASPEDVIASFGAGGIPSRTEQAAMLGTTQGTIRGQAAAEARTNAPASVQERADRAVASSGLTPATAYDGSRVASGAPMNRGSSYTTGGTMGGPAQARSVASSGMTPANAAAPQAPTVANAAPADPRAEAAIAALADFSVPTPNQERERLAAVVDAIRGAPPAAPSVASVAAPAPATAAPAPTVAPGAPIDITPQAPATTTPAAPATVAQPNWFERNVAPRLTEAAIAAIPGIGPLAVGASRISGLFDGPTIGSIIGEQIPAADPRSFAQVMGLPQFDRDPTMDNANETSRDREGSGGGGEAAPAAPQAPAPNREEQLRALLASLVQERIQQATSGRPLSAISSGQPLAPDPVVVTLAELVRNMPQRAAA